VADSRSDTMRLSLHVISRVGFGVNMLWPAGEKEASDETEGRATPEQGEMSSAEVVDGHTMSYRDALETLLRNILWVLLMPQWLLSMQSGDVNILHMSNTWDRVFSPPGPQKIIRCVRRVGKLYA